jgi:hypothetical protein
VYNKARWSTVANEGFYTYLFDTYATGCIHLLCRHDDGQLGRNMLRNGAEGRETEVQRILIKLHKDKTQKRHSG